MDFNVKRLAADAGTFFSRAVQVINRSSLLLSEYNWNGPGLLKIWTSHVIRTLSPAGYTSYFGFV